MKRISTFTYVYCGIILAGTVFLCTSFFRDQTVSAIERTTEMVNNGIFMAGEIFDSVSANNLTRSEEIDELETTGAEALEAIEKANEEPAQETAEAVKPILPVEEYEALCKIVQAEAGNQGAKGKQLIANVVLNRVKNDKFPDTVQEVILQDNGGITQFSPTKNGSYHAAEISIDTMAAVNRALAGEDLSGGALYFKAGSETSWGGLDFLFQHGNHVFFK